MTVDPRVLARTTLRHRCPACGEGPLFRRAYALRDRCEACGLDLSGRHGAHYGGPLILGYTIGGTTGLLAFALLAAAFGFASWIAWVSMAAVVGSILVTFRHCKAFWTWWLYETGELGAETPSPSGVSGASAAPAADPGSGSTGGG